MKDSYSTFTVITWGCQMNEDDSTQISALMSGMGYIRVESVTDADIIFLNTCSVRSKPEHKVKTKLGELKLLKDFRPHIIIGVCGCMAQKEGERLRSDAPFIDMLVGTAAIERIPELLHKVIESKNRISALEMPEKPGDTLSVPKRLYIQPKLKAYVPIMYGCDNFCSYCVVPYTRGRERSRDIKEIKEEIEHLASGGCKEIMLLGQNVNSYDGGDGSHDFSDVLSMANNIEGIERIRFMTSHPKDLSPNLIFAIASLPKVCRHFHLPVQSGSDRILKKMNRKYTAAEYLEKLKALRDSVPGISITTDLIVGFPGETDDDFEETIKLVEEARFDEAFMFAYSAMRGTAAAEMPNQVPYQVKQERLRFLIEKQNAITTEINSSQLGTIFDVLVEKVSPKDPSKVSGLTSSNKTMVFEGSSNLIGKIVPVKAQKPYIWGFSGEAVLDRV